MNTKSIFVIAVALAACGGNPAPKNPQPMVVQGPVVWNGDPDLAPLLVLPTLEAEQWAMADLIEQRLGPSVFIDRLGAAVEDSTAPWLVRLNAIRVIEKRRATGELGTLATAMKASDERVRIASLAAMRAFGTSESTRQILIAGLNDPSPRVQSTALQFLGEGDVKVIREYAARTKDAQLRAVANDLIRAAEGRGAPLATIDANGTLERNAEGAKLTYRPTTRWQDWDASVGDLIVTAAGKKPVTVASGVEVVGNVVPAFFTTDGATLVYEVNREIHARMLATGADIKLADGIAPRMLPFTNDVIYLVEQREKRINRPKDYGLTYHAFRVPASGGTPVQLGQLDATAQHDLKGNYSPVRWIRVEESNGVFSLNGQNVKPLRLPSPFTN